MKVSGFTFIRNAIKLDYPVEEAIRSILPLCDEMVVAVGKSDDDTLSLIKSIDADKIRIIETTWDDSLREGGRVLALETDKAFQAVAEDSDWAFYIQGDEVIHEKYLPRIKEAMLCYKDNAHVEGLLFNYKHFYGSYDYIGISHNWYRKEIRIVRNDKKVFSFRDAQGFRINDNKKLKVKQIDAYVYHYGWVKDPKAMQRKQTNFHSLYHSDEWIDKNVAKSDEFDYSEIDALAIFTETHPKVMEDRIKRLNWKFDFDISYNKFSVKEKIKQLTGKWFGVMIGEYRNYILLK